MTDANSHISPAKPESTSCDDAYLSNWLRTIAQSATKDDHGVSYCMVAKSSILHLADRLDALSPPPSKENVAISTTTAKAIVDKISDAWGDEEDARVAKDISPLITEALTELANTIRPLDRSPPFFFHRLANQTAEKIIQLISEGWGDKEDAKAILEIIPILAAAFKSAAADISAAKEIVPELTDGN